MFIFTLCGLASPAVKYADTTRMRLHVLAGFKTVPPSQHRHANRHFHYRPISCIPWSRIIPPLVSHIPLRHSVILTNPSESFYKSKRGTRILKSFNKIFTSTTGRRFINVCMYTARVLKHSLSGVVCVNTLLRINKALRYHIYRMLRKTDGFRARILPYLQTLRALRIYHKFRWMFAWQI
jgi:hypothetical protein